MAGRAHLPQQSESWLQIPIVKKKTAGRINPYCTQCFPFIDEENALDNDPSVRGLLFLLATMEPVTIILFISVNRLSESFYQQ